MAKPIVSDPFLPMLFTLKMVAFSTVWVGLGGFAYLVPYSQPSLDINRTCVWVYVKTDSLHTALLAAVRHNIVTKSTVISLRPTYQEFSQSSNQSVTVDHSITSCTNTLS